MKNNETVKNYPKRIMNSEINLGKFVDRYTISFRGLFEKGV